MDKEMLSAQNEEFERQKRLMELKKSLLVESAAESAGPIASTATVTHSAGISTANEKDSQLKSLLQGLCYVCSLHLFYQMHYKLFY